MISVSNYLNQTRELLSAGTFTDGCTTPLKNYIHKWLSKSHLLCAAHDFGGIGLIKGVKPGIENNFQTWIAHLANFNPIYWIWGTIVAVVTLPWVVWKHNLGMNWLSFYEFHGIILAGCVVKLLLFVQPYFQ